MAKAKKKTRKTRSDKKPRYKKCAREHRLYEGVKVVLPCRHSKLTPAHKAKIDDTFTDAEWRSCRGLAKKKKGDCRVIFFKAGKPIMRRSDRKLSTPAKKRARKARAKRQARYAKTAPRAKRGRFR